MKKTTISANEIKLAINSANDTVFTESVMDLLRKVQLPLVKNISGFMVVHYSIDSLLFK